MRTCFVALLVTFTACGGETDEKDGEKISEEKAREIEKKQEAAAKSAEAAPNLDKVYKHGCGVYFMYPSGWKMQEQQDFIVLEPDDAFVHKGQPAEFYLVYGEDAGGITNPEDPSVRQTVNQAAKQLFPWLKSESGAEGELSWTGKSPTGLDAQAKSFLTIQGSYIVGIFYLGPKDQWAKRKTVTHDIFRTFGFEKPKSDPRLVGKWRKEKTYMSGSFSMITVNYLFLMADGTCTYGGKMAGGMSHSDMTGAYTGDSTFSSEGGITHKGKWRTEGKTLIMEWSDNTYEKWEIYIEGASMLFKDGKKRQVWEKVG